MVLRKPYRFLIRHFKFIHLILAFLSGYLLTRTNELIKFYNDYINNSNTLVGIGTSEEYFTSFMTISMIGILIGSIIILIIMRMKNKPIIFYIINIIMYLIVMVVYMYDKSMIQKLELSTLDIRRIKLASDITLICFLTQTLSTIILFIRGIGFNIKKFDFEQDLKFDIDESDNEEFEFSVNIDKNKIRRKINRVLRNFKYSYHENKFLINIIMVIIIFIVSILLYMNFQVWNKIYKQKQIINASDFTFTITDSYLIDTDYKNKQITDNYLVVSRIRLSNNSVEKRPFETGKVLLNIGKIKYNPTTKYKNKLVDLGITYNGQKLDTAYSEYLLVFEIPKKYASKKKILTYSDSYVGTFKIRISSKKIGKKETSKSKINNEMKLNSGVINNVSFKITKVTISDRIRSTYTFCETKNNCYESYEYIVPSLTDNYNKTILRIDGTYNINDQTIPGFSDLADYIATFGSIKYTINGEEKQMTSKIKEVLPTKAKKKNVYFFEVYEDIKNASNISLILTIRNNKYEYVLR